MDFHLSPEQELLRDSARRHFSTRAGFGQRSVAGNSVDAAAKTDDWLRFADLGWLAMLVPEAAGGLDAAIEDIALLSEEMGRGLTQAPFVGGAVLPARIIGRCHSYERRESLLSSIAENATRLAVAVYEPDRRYDLLPGTIAVLMADGSYRLSGRKSLVAGGAQADQLIVSARLKRTGEVSSSPALFLIGTDRAGVRRHIFETLDGVPVADITLDEVAATPLEILAGTDSAPAILQNAIDEAVVCLCAEMLGCLDQAIQLTANHLKLRKQFGQPLAGFQVLQHTVAEMSIEASSARSILYRAIGALGTSGAARAKATSGCCIKVAQAAKWITGTAVHLHGGIGMTCEYPVGHYLRRVLVSERSFGDREYHLARYLSFREAAP